MINIKDVSTTKVPQFGIRTRKWTAEEHDLMCRFIKMNKFLLIAQMKQYVRSRMKINKYRFFIEMAEFIGTKTESQCKSRYQKKERTMLEALSIPSGLIDMYMRTRLLKPSVTKHIPIHSDSNKEINSKNEIDHNDFIDNSQTINDQDNENLNCSLMPYVQNDIIRDQIENFLTNLQTNHNEVDSNKSINNNNISFYIPLLNMSLLNNNDIEPLSCEGSLTILK